MTIAGSPTYILACSEMDTEYYPQTPWGTDWHEVFSAPLDELLARYDIVVPAPAVLTGHIKLPKTQIFAVVCDCHTMLAKLDRLHTSHLIFAPSALDILEAHRKSRRTLSSNCFLRKGEILSDEALCEETTGTGVNVKYRDVLVGRVIAHDIEPNSPIDFGSVI